MLKAQHTDSKAAVPSACLAPGMGFTEDSFSMVRTGMWWWWGDGFEMIQVHYVSCALQLHDYIRPTSDDQALDPGAGTLLCRNVSCDDDGEAVATINTWSRKSQVSPDRLWHASSPGRWPYTLEVSWVPLPDVSQLGSPQSDCHPPLQIRFVKYAALNLQGPIYGAHQALWPYGYFTRLPLKVMCSDIHRSHWVSAAVAGCVEELKLIKCCLGLPYTT